METIIQKCLYQKANYNKRMLIDNCYIIIECSPNAASVVINFDDDYYEFVKVISEYTINVDLLEA
jgi:hypothetical protein